MGVTLGLHRDYIGVIRVLKGLEWDNGKKMETTIMGYMGGCQNYGPFLDPYYNKAPNISGTQEGTIILATTHMNVPPLGCGLGFRAG